MLNVNLRHDKRAMKTTNDDKHTKDGLLLGRRKMFGLKCFMCPHNASIDSPFVFSLFSSLPEWRNIASAICRRCRVTCVDFWHYYVTKSCLAPQLIPPHQSLYLVESRWGYLICFFSGFIIQMCCMKYFRRFDGIDLFVFRNIAIFFYNFCVQMQISHDLWSKH